MDCLFCKIIAKEIPAEIVYEDEKVLAFLDINPVNPGHVLVVPKVHSENMAVAADDDLVAVIRIVKKLAPKVCAATACDSFNLQVVGELVPHTHVHIIPRFKNDGLKHWPGHPYPAGEQAAMGEKIRKAMNN